MSDKNYKMEKTTKIMLTLMTSKEDRSIARKLFVEAEVFAEMKAKQVNSNKQKQAVAEG